MTERHQIHWQGMYIYVVGVMLLIGIAIRMIGLSKGIWLDEYASINIISAPDFAQSVKSYDYPPLYFYLLKVWATISIQESFLRTLSVILNLSAVIVFVLWIKRYSYLASVVAGSLFMTLPVVLRYSHEIQSYALLLPATATAFFFASRLSTDRENFVNHIGLALGLTMAVATHLVGVILIPTIGLFIILSLPSPRRILSPGFLISFLIPCIAFALIFFVFLERPSKQDWWMPIPTLEIISGTAKYVFGWNALFWPLPRIQVYAPYLAIPFDWSIKILTFLYLAALIGFGNWRRSFPLFAAAFAYWLQMLVISFLLVPIFWYRTVLPGLIPLVGFVGIQCATTQRKYIKLFLVSYTIFLSLYLSVNWIVNDARIPIESWRETAELLEAQRGTEDIVVFFPDYAEGPIHYYADSLAPTNVVNIKPAGELDKLKESIESKNPDYLFLAVCRRGDFIFVTG